MLQQKILFATDFSKRNLPAWKMACDIAKAWRAQLLITHVDADSKFEPAGSKLPVNWNAAQKLREILPDDISVDYEHKLIKGEPAEALHKLELAENVELIVLGTHGRKGLDRVFNGSVAEQVIRTAHCPVMTVRQSDSEVPEHRDHEFKILVPTDFSVHSYAALDFASSLAQAFSAGITILYVDDSVDTATRQFPHGRPEWSSYRDEIWKQLRKVDPKKQNVQFGHKILEGSPATEITDYAHEKDYDIIVLGTHGRTGVGRVLLGSVAEKVVRNAHTAVITVKPSNKRHAVLH